MNSLMKKKGNMVKMMMAVALTMAVVLMVGNLETVTVFATKNTTANNVKNGVADFNTVTSPIIGLIILANDFNCCFI